MPKEDLLQYFDSCVAYIEEGIKEGGNVLVHCAMGVSRSATVVVAFLMKNKGMKRDEAIDWVKSKRHINPNKGFME